MAWRSCHRRGTKAAVFGCRFQPAAITKHFDFTHMKLLCNDGDGNQSQIETLIKMRNCMYSLFRRAMSFSAKLFPSNIGISTNDLLKLFKGRKRKVPKSAKKKTLSFVLSRFFEWCFSAPLGRLCMSSCPRLSMICSFWCWFRVLLMSCNGCSF